jgi:hypothetical protein
MDLKRLGSDEESFEVLMKILMLHIESTSGIASNVSYVRYIKLYLMQLLSYDNSLVREFLNTYLKTKLYSIKLDKIKSQLWPLNPILHPAAAHFMTF